MLWLCYAFPRLSRARDVASFPLTLHPHRHISFHWCWVSVWDVGIGNRPCYQDCSSVVVVNRNKEFAAAVPAPSAPAWVFQSRYCAIWTPLFKLGSWGQTGADGCPLTSRGGLRKGGGRAFSSVTQCARSSRDAVSLFPCSFAVEILRISNTHLPWREKAAVGFFYFFLNSFVFSYCSSKEKYLLLSIS